MSPLQLLWICPVCAGFGAVAAALLVAEGRYSDVEGFDWEPGEEKILRCAQDDNEGKILRCAQDDRGGAAQDDREKEK